MSHSTHPAPIATPLVKWCLARRIPYSRARLDLIAGHLPGYQDDRGKLWVLVEPERAAA